MDGQGIFVLHALLTCNKTTFPFLELEIMRISISCNFITEYSATNINRVTCCHVVTFEVYVNDLGYANTEKDLVWVSKSLCLLRGACWVRLGLPNLVWWANCISFLANQSIALWNFISEFSDIWCLLILHFGLASHETHLLANCFLSSWVSIRTNYVNSSKDLWKKWCLAICTYADGKIR